MNKWIKRNLINSPHRNDQDERFWTEVYPNVEHEEERNQQHLQHAHVYHGRELLHTNEVFLHPPVALLPSQADCWEAFPILRLTYERSNFFLLQGGQRIPRERLSFKKTNIFFGLERVNGTWRDNVSGNFLSKLWMTSLIRVSSIPKGNRVTNIKSSSLKI